VGTKRAPLYGRGETSRGREPNNRKATREERVPGRSEKKLKKGLARGKESNHLWITRLGGEGRDPLPVRHTETGLLAHGGGKEGLKGKASSYRGGQTGKSKEKKRNLGFGWKRSSAKKQSKEKKKRKSSGEKGHVRTRASVSEGGQGGGERR